ncbi:hypothetical protein JCM16303_004941 [Sporobolomyces ruberrimus]
MNGQPTTPPRRIANPTSAYQQHLHKRSVSRTPSSLNFSPPSNRSSPTYRLMHDSPRHPRSRLAESVASATEFVGGKRGKEWTTMRKIVVLAVITIGLIVLGERSWNSEARMAGSRTIDELSGMKQNGREAKLDLVKGSALGDRPGDGVSLERQSVSKPDRWVKVSKPSRLDSIQTTDSPPPAPPPAYPFDPSQRFIFVGWMGEQETKAQAHLYQLGLLALATNRTLVLPGVRKSRFGSCYIENPFSLYYATDSLDRFNIPYITHSDFSSWVTRHEEDPSARIVSLVRGSSVPLDTLDATVEHFCIDKLRVDYARHPHKAFFIPLTDWKSPQVRTAYGEEVVTGLANEDASVLVVQYNLRFPFLTPESIASLSPYEFPAPRPYSYFPYSHHWTTLGNSIADQISPFVGVHWRTETLDVERIASCGTALVQELRKIHKENPAINTLYLATDYPLDFIRNGGHLPRNVVANSGTMSKTLTPGHHEAMRSFLSLLEGETDDDSFHLTTFSEESRLVQLDPELEAMLPDNDASGGGGGVASLDPAIAGLVDKIVLSNAELFYAGLPVSDDKLKGCAKLSQFTTQIITGRKESLAKSASEDEETRLWNDVGHFSL